MNREEWEKPYLEARLWWCEDEVCDCTQPQIDLCEPNWEAGYPWIKRKTVWEGTFHSEADREESENQRAELIKKAAEMGIPLDEDLYGTKTATATDTQTI